MARKQYAAIASVVVAGKRYSPGADFMADPEDEDVKRQLASHAMRSLDFDEDQAPAPSKAKRGRHERRDMRASG